MTKKQKLLVNLKLVKELGDNDPEAAHGEADELLIQYINDPEIRTAYDAIPKWYA